MGGVPSRLAVTHLMPIEFVLNVSLLEKNFYGREGQRLDGVMSTICHKLSCAPQRELDFCSRTVTIVLGICLS
jgi:hypothetical protein